MAGKVAEDKKQANKQQNSKTNPSVKNRQKDSQEAIAMSQTPMIAPAYFSNPSK